MTVEGKVPSVLDWALYHENCWRQELVAMYEGWNFHSGNYLFTTDTK